MSASYLARIYSSERISSSHGPDIFYEIVHAHVKHEPNSPDGTDVVILRMVQGDRPAEAMAPEIHVKDLMEVEERFLVFMDRVRKKSGDSTQMNVAFSSSVSPVAGVAITQPPATPQPQAQPPAVVSTPTPAPMMSPLWQQTPTPTPGQAPAYTPEMGRYAPNAPRRKIGGLPEDMVRMGPKKSSFALDASGNIVGGAKTPTPGSVPAYGSTDKPSGSYNVNAGPEMISSYEIVPFTLQKPPDLETVMRVLTDDPMRLVVVARMELQDKIKVYLENVIRGDGALANRPGVFSAIVLQRQGGKINFKAKMSGPLALALQQIVANPTKVLWVPPEGAMSAK